MDVLQELGLCGCRVSTEKNVEFTPRVSLPLLLLSPLLLLLVGKQKTRSPNELTENPFLYIVSSYD